jgi:hypothetical protein
VAKSDSSGCDSMSVFEAFLKRTTLVVLVANTANTYTHCADRYIALSTICVIVPSLSHSALTYCNCECEEAPVASTVVRRCVFGDTVTVTVNSMVV